MAELQTPLSKADSLGYALPEPSSRDSISVCNHAIYLRGYLSPSSPLDFKAPGPNQGLVQTHSTILSKWLNSFKI